MSNQRQRQGLIGVVAVVLLAAAAYLIFFRGDGSASPKAAEAEARADAVSKAMEAGGATAAPAPDIQHPSIRGAVNQKGTR